MCSCGQQSVILGCLFPWTISWSSYRNAALLAEWPSHGFFISWGNQCLFLSPKKANSGNFRCPAIPSASLFCWSVCASPLWWVAHWAKGSFLLLKVRAGWGEEEEDGAGQSIPLLGGNGNDQTALLACEKGNRTGNRTAPRCRSTRNDHKSKCSFG